MTTKFRYQAKTFYFTYPKCDALPEDCMDKLKELGIEWAIIAQEKHADETLHLHMCGKWTKKIHTRDATFFDKIAGKHGNYQPMKKQSECISYCIKDDNYICYGIDPVEAVKKGKKTKVGDEVVKLILEGASNREIMNYNPGYYLVQRTKIHALREELQLDEPDVPTSFDCPEADESTLGWNDVSNWLFDNILKARAFKQKQLWLYGPPNSGKSSMLMELHKRLRVYTLSNDKWDDDYNDDRFDVIVADEFTGWKTVSYLNSLCDGSVKKMLRRCMPPISKKVNLPVIICSNLSIDEVYSKALPVQREALHARFHQVYVDKPGLSWAAESDSDTEIVDDETDVLESPQLKRCDALMNSGMLERNELEDFVTSKDLNDQLLCLDETLEDLDYDDFLFYDGYDDNLDDYI